jgi:SAM-dependent methyltransferase
MAAHFDRLASLRDTWFDRNHLYHEQTIKVCRPFLNPDSRVLELGCNTGRLLGELNHAFGVGVDISQKSLDVARESYPQMQWIHADAESLPDHPALAEPFDLIILEDLVGHLWDIEQFFKDIRRLTHSNTRLVVSCWNWIWEPVLRFTEGIGVKAPNLDVHENWLSALALTHFLKLADFEVVLQQPGILFPYQVPVLTELINSLSYAPLLDRFVLSTILVARPLPDPAAPEYSVLFTVFVTPPIYCNS